VTDRCRNGRKDLQHNEDDAHEREGSREGLALLHGGNERSHCNSEKRRQDSAQQHDQPPGKRKDGIRPRQSRKKQPFLTLTQTLEHTGLPRFDSNRTIVVRLLLVPAPEV
jgi:hypothetical protein